MKVHPTAEVNTTNIGQHTQIWQFSVILKDAQIGMNCNINCHVFIENDVIIGDNVTIKPGVQIWDGVRLGSNVFVGPNVTFTNDLFPRSKQRPEKFAETFVEDGVSIGANSTLVAGIRIGRYSMIGAGSVVTRNIPPFTCWYGNPARFKGFITKEGIVISPQLIDKSGNTYYLVNDEPIKL